MVNHWPQVNHWQMSVRDQLSTQAQSTQKPGPFHFYLPPQNLPDLQPQRQEFSRQCLLVCLLFVCLFVLEIYIDKPISAKATPGLTQYSPGKPGEKNIFKFKQRPGTGKCWKRKGSLWPVLHHGRNLIFS